MHKKQDSWLRRHAIQLAGQLPEDTDDSLLIIDAGCASWFCNILGRKIEERGLPVLTRY
jgi:hypothetical protein